jgi:hypothetical protein
MTVHRDNVWQRLRRIATTVRRDFAAAFGFSDSHEGQMINPWLLAGAGEKFQSIPAPNIFPSETETREDGLLFVTGGKPLITGNWTATPPEATKGDVMITGGWVAVPPELLSAAEQLQQVRESWPDGDTPVFDQIDTDVTHPRTKTGQPTKQGPKLPFTGGLPFDAYMQSVKDDFARVDAEYRAVWH